MSLNKSNGYFTEADPVQTNLKSVYSHAIAILHCTLLK